MKILVTGATGFAGSHLLETLSSLGEHEVFGTRFRSGGSSEPHMNQHSMISLDLTDKGATMDVVRQVKPDQIYHLASFAFVGKSFERGEEVLSNNIQVQVNMLEAMRLHVPNARMLSIGSAEEYGYSESGELPISETHPFRPINPYAVSKLTQEMLALAYAKSYELDIVRVRPFNHIGERQSSDFAIPAFAKQIVAIERGLQEKISVGKLDAIRDFTDVKDMVRGYALVMDKGVSGDVYNIGSGVGVKMQSVLDQLVELSGNSVEIAYDIERVRPFDIPEIVADNKKICALGWNPTIPLSDSLRRVLEYWRAL